MILPSHPAAPGPTGDVDQVVTLTHEAAGVDRAAVEALEAVVAALRRARAARTQQVTQVPTDVLRRPLRPGLLRQDGVSS